MTLKTTSSGILDILLASSDDPVDKLQILLVAEYEANRPVKLNIPALSRKLYVSENRLRSHLESLVREELLMTDGDEWVIKPVNMTVEIVPSAVVGRLVINLTSKNYIPKEK